MPGREGYYKPGKKAIEDTILRLGNPKEILKKSVRTAKDSAKKQVKKLGY